MTMTNRLKHCLNRVGEHVSPRTIDRFSAALNYLEVGRWARDNEFHTAFQAQRREQLFDLVGNRIGNLDVLYLEFGVWNGESMRYWSKLLRNPNSELHGFDSFEGLPEDFTPLTRRGAFSLNGNAPRFDDPRYRLFKGWFQDTLTSYKVPAHDVLVMNMDADLYSSTIFVLNSLEKAILPGTYIYFDEFYDRSQ